MAVSKRTRFEVLRRDEFTCRYCHRVDNELTVDHVVPVALGGSDDPSNLVAACKACNAGKSSASPDAPLVAQVESDAIRWAAALRLAADRAQDDRDSRDGYVILFDQAWRLWSYPRDLGWEQSVWRFHSLGLPIDDLLDSVRIACNNSRINVGDTFTYMCGVAWSKVREYQDAARHLIDAGEV